MLQLLLVIASVMLCAQAADAGLPDNIKQYRNISYGIDDEQRFDVYTPISAIQHAPVIFMVHGGAWRFGDKSSARVIDNKVARWVPRGFIFISANYRLLPKADPLKQLRDVAQALVTAQGKASAWGGDSTKFILMGHSAGAHLVALLNTEPEQAISLGAKPWLGAVALDSAAYNVVQIMQRRHYRFYDKAFGNDKAYWKAASPYYELLNHKARDPAHRSPPLLAVCSSRRNISCAQAHAFAKKANALGKRVQVLVQDQTHRSINETLGIDNAYTNAVESFIATLDLSISRKLGIPYKTGH